MLERLFLDSLRVVPSLEDAEVLLHVELVQRLLLGAFVALLLALSARVLRSPQHRPVSRAHRHEFVDDRRGGFLSLGRRGRLGLGHRGLDRAAGPEAESGPATGGLVDVGSDIIPVVIRGGRSSSSLSTRALRYDPSAVRLREMRAQVEVPRAVP